MLFTSHQRSFFAFIIFILICSLARPVSATEFAVLRQRFVNSATFDIPSTGDQSSFRPRHIYFEFPDNDLDPNSDEQLAVDTDPTLNASDPSPPPGSYLFNVTLTDVSTGQMSTKFSDPATIGFDGDLPSGSVDQEMCLGYLDSSTNTWVIQDAALLRNSTGQLCGTTNHLTTFFFGLTSTVPEPASTTGLIAIIGLICRRARS